MTQSSGKVLTPRSRDELQLIANIPPTVRQRRMAHVLVLALLAILAATWPFATIKLPEIRAFVPSLAAALFISDSVTAVLLFGQFSILRQWALLVIANGYVFSALIVVAHALAFPGAFSDSGLFGSAVQSAVWLYWFWHSGLPLAIIGYALLKNTDRTVSARSTRFAIGASVAATVAVVVGIFWFVTQHHDLLPVTFVDVHPLSLFRRIIGGVVILALGGVALCLLWLRRRTLLDEWLIVALCALLIEVALASVLSGDRYTLSWYAGRFYQVVTAAVVMVVLLAEMTTLYASLARTNTMLQSERDNKLTTLEAMAASISHEVRQPLAAIATRGDTALRLLSRTPVDVEKVGSNLTTIVGESHRASQVFDNIRTLFGSADAERQAIDVNEIVLGTLRILRAELEERRVTTRMELSSGLPLVMGHAGQIQEVILNLVHNAIEAMDAVTDGPRILQVKTARNGHDAIAVAVEDSGPGIDAEKLGNIFDPFVTSKPRGMGLGLAICRMTIERHGGQLSASAAKSKGALFQFVLPIKASQGAAGDPP
jgi:signal transduction histidine kinase